MQRAACMHWFRGFEHPWILVSMGVLIPIPCAHLGQLKLGKKWKFMHGFLTARRSAPLTATLLKSQLCGLANVFVVFHGEDTGPQSRQAQIETISSWFFLGLFLPKGIIKWMYCVPLLQNSVVSCLREYNEALPRFRPEHEDRPSATKKA